MLVLTRKTQEKIQIGDSITITILRVQGQAVRIGIEAPDDVRVLRGELVAEERKAKAALRGESSRSGGSLLQFRASHGARGASAPWESPTAVAAPSGG